MSKKTFGINGEGIINYLRCSNSGITLKCLSSGQGSGAADDFITFSKVSCWSLNVPNSWFAVDLGSGRRVAATHYSIRYASPGNACCFRDWILQGSNVAPAAQYNPKDTNWVTLAIHKNDNSVNSAYGSKIWAVPIPKGIDPYFRYFRVVQTGRNAFVRPKHDKDDWSNVFVVGGFEVWGELIDEIPDPKNAAFGAVDGFYPPNSAKQGVIYNLKDKVQIKVTSSSISKGKPQDFIATENVFCWTKNEKNSWFCVDFGDSVLVNPTHYLLRYASSANYCCPRNWLLQGANNPDFSKYFNDPNEDPLWTTLSRHTNDMSLTGDFSSHLYQLNGTQAFRYFRVIQTGKNAYTGQDAWGDVFVAGGFELFGYSNKRLPSLPSKSCAYSHDLDGNGVVAYLQSFGLRPLVICSSIGRGQAPDFISRLQVNCWTKNEKFSWLCVDMGENVRVIPSFYTLGYSSGGTACCIRYWVFQASNSFSTSTDPSKDETWINLSIHNNDTSIGSAHATKTWALPQLTQGFRFFRVLQTGKNAYAQQVQKTGNVDDWSDCLVAGKFEIYGYVSTLGSNPQSSIVNSSSGSQNLFSNNPFVSTAPVVSNSNSLLPVPPPYNPALISKPPTPQNANATLRSPETSVLPSAPAIDSTTTTAEALANLNITTECSVCMTNPKNALIVPCGHLTMCFDCATKVMNTSRTCPICRMPIDKVIKAFIA